MKRRFLSITFLLFSILTSAQINLNDSTVSVVGYWSIGDKYKFESTSEKLRIIGNDTIILDNKDEIFSLEVVDSTDTYYILNYDIIESSENKKEKTAIDSLIDEKIKLIGKDIPILLKTDHLGAFQDIANWEEMEVAIKEMVELLSNDLWDFVPETLKESVFQEKEAFIANAFAPILTKEFYLSSLKHVIQLFYFHGIEYDMEKVYDYTDQRFSPWDGTMIDTTGELWIEDINEEDGFATICNNSHLNSDQLLGSYLNYLNKMAGNANKPNLNNIPYVFTEEQCNAIIHVDSGWTTNTYFELQTEVKNVIHQHIIKVNMLFDDDEPTDSTEI